MTCSRLRMYEYEIIPLKSNVVCISQRELESSTCHCFEQRLMLISHFIELVNAATSVVGQNQRASFQRIFTWRAFFMKGDLREKIWSFRWGTSFQLVLTCFLIPYRKQGRHYWACGCVCVWHAPPFIFKGPQNSGKIWPGKAENGRNVRILYSSWVKFGQLRPWLRPWYGDVMKTLKTNKMLWFVNEWMCFLCGASLIFVSTEWNASLVGMAKEIPNSEILNFNTLASTLCHSNSELACSWCIYICSNIDKICNFLIHSFQSIHFNPFFSIIDNQTYG